MCNTNQEEKHRHEFRAVSTGARFFGRMIVRFMFMVAFALVLAVVVMWLWNRLMPGVFGLAVITYWQAFGLMILARLILGTIGPGSRGYRPHDKRPWGDRFKYHHYSSGDMGNEKDINGTMKWWHNYKRFWRDEGKAAFDAYVKRAKEGEPKGKTDKTDKK